MDDKAELNLTEIVVIGLDGYKTENKATSNFSNEKIRKGVLFGSKTDLI
jgi:hypothetical protein